ncbi:MAG: hypothetical protein K6F06_09930 [Bacteroidales bacterium]|nr:hypothetical protein [Bacteroidales bacterium]
MNHISGSFSLNKGKLDDFSHGALSWEDDHHIIKILGHLDGASDPSGAGSIISEAFLAYHDDLTLHLSGVYLVMVYEKRKPALHFYQGLSSFPLALYYTTNNGVLCYSTSLKVILKYSGIQREFDEEGLREFLFNGHILGGNTLVKNVYKLEPHKSLFASIASVTQVPARYSIPSLSEEEAKEKWNPVLERAIRQSFDGEGEINMAISSGYDSNYIMYVASKGGLPINAFSVGGGSGADELPIVKKNVKEYENVSLFTARTDSDSLSCLPDIVWRLEGSVFERGIFLQYELARLVKRSGKSYMILGEGADQVMNVNYMDQSGLSIDGRVVKVTSREYPYHYANNMVLKKNGIISNSFGIDCRYPYLDSEFVSVAHAMRHLNGVKKWFHVDNCKRILSPGICDTISKIGGATDCHSLFPSAADISKFESIDRKSDFYKFISGFSDRSEKLTVKKAYVDFLSMVCRVFRIPEVNAPKKVYRRDEVLLREHVCYLYLFLFKELLLSGKYDHMLDNQGINLRLSDFFPAL